MNSIKVKNNLKVISFYRFKTIKNTKILKNKIEIYLKKKNIRGTILLASEGINGSLAGREIELIKTIRFLKKCMNIRKLRLRINSIDYLPFNRTKIRLKKEIVSLGKGKINVNKLKGKLVSPDEWNKLVKNKKTKILDVRNIYEVDIGKFDRSISPNTNTFRQFTYKFEMLNIKRDASIAMYCTGGVRCEKASSYLKKIGYKNVYQLEGGILNYLDYKIRNKKIKSHWKGECFVFDDRVAVNKDLKKGEYFQCYGCRSAITKKDIKSKFYKKGVYCPNCYYLRSVEQKNSSETRQFQIELNRKKNIRDSFSKNF